MCVYTLKEIRDKYKKIKKMYPLKNSSSTGLVVSNFIVSYRSRVNKAMLFLCEIGVEQRLEAIGTDVFAENETLFGLCGIKVTNIKATHLVALNYVQAEFLGLPYNDAEYQRITSS